MKKNLLIPVIDLFAGPGGLGEGFSAYNKQDNHFKIQLSVEKDEVAHQTLLLRAFYRQFDYGKAPDEYYDLLKAKKFKVDILENMLKSFGKESLAAKKEALCLELGTKLNNIIFRKIREVLEDTLKHGKPWVLIGGPPCQAYSLVGRARNKANPDWSLEEDGRSVLYKDYLKILAKFQPAIFVMENVKGILSANLGGEKVIDLITNDLKRPSKANYIHVDPLNGRHYVYHLFSFVKPYSFDKAFLPSDFLIKTEYYGIPQKRHRVIILGVREDYNDSTFDILQRVPQIPIEKAIGDMPPRFSSFSRRKTNLTEFDQQLLAYSDWKKMLNDYFSKITRFNGQLRQTLDNNLKRLKNSRTWSKRKIFDPDWFLCDKLKGYYISHNSRSHMRSDILRYFFVSCFGETFSKSPKLADFPPDLLPAHENAGSENFVDRFKVQLKSRPSTTITCHISKDGHYYIHPDPCQCRSLTVREAARLQTFPDDYFFCGNRTQQYHQVGNAVPPLLARQIAGVVYQILEKTGKT